MITIKPPTGIPYSYGPLLFLAGSIEMGAAVDWQAEVTEKLSTYDNLVVANPRRDDWDTSWEQSLDSPQFVEQVEWELLNLNEANYVFMFIDPATKSPITLLEFGMLVSQMGDRLVVVCPPGFYRKGNIDVTARFWDVPVYSTITGGLAALNIVLSRDGVS